VPLVRRPHKKANDFQRRPIEISIGSLVRDVKTRLSGLILLVFFHNAGAPTQQEGAPLAWEMITIADGGRVEAPGHPDELSKVQL
jgi:hypothetical protein